MTADGGVNLNKVTLTKSAPTVSLTKHGSATGLLRINLNWASRPVGPATGTGPIDLDLACLWEFTDGRKGVVQALGNALAIHDQQGARVMWLDGDDRSGESDDGENIFIDLAFLPLIKRLLVFTFIYEGAASWAAADAIVTLHPRSGPLVEVHLDESNAAARACAIALLQNDGNDLSVTREVRYASGHQEIDTMFGWGLQWVAGRKD